MGNYETPYITVTVAARKYIFRSVSHVRGMCLEGIFKTARKPTTKKRGHWQIARAEVIQVCTKHQRDYNT